MTALWLLLAGLAATLVVFILAACKAAGNADRESEEIFRDLTERK